MADRDPARPGLPLIFVRPAIDFAELLRRVAGYGGAANVVQMGAPTGATTIRFTRSV